MFEILILKTIVWHKINYTKFLLAHHDQQALLEKLDNLKRELEAEKQALERAVREAAVKAEHDRNAANQLRDEISKLKTKMEENRYIEEQ